MQQAHLPNHAQTAKNKLMEILDIKPVEEPPKNNNVN